MCSLKEKISDFLINSFLGAEEKLYEKIRLRQKREKELRKTEKKKFIILLDYENVWTAPLGAGKGRNKLQDLSWLIEPILAEGEILFSMAFVSDNLVGTVPMELHDAGFVVVGTPPKLDGMVWKHTDSADQIMLRTGKNLVQHCNVTDVVIVSGDADFTDLINFARFKGCRVKVVAYQKSLSRRLQRPGVKIEYIENGA